MSLTPLLKGVSHNVNKVDTKNAIGIKFHSKSWAPKVCQITFSWSSACRGSAKGLLTAVSSPEFVVKFNTYNIM